jgi:hypothetical protein
MTFFFTRALPPADTLDTMRVRPGSFASAALLLALGTHPAVGQPVEVAGTRALGMGGAFTAVADDSSATWWNPGALAAGPFFDGAVGRAWIDPARFQRGSATWVALATPPFGLSNYRLRLASTRSLDPTGGGAGNREQDGGADPVYHWQVSQWGATIVQTLLPGVHAGATLKYVRGTVRVGQPEAGAGEDARLDVAEGLTDGDHRSRFDLDAGVLAVAGPVRVGAVVRHLREPDFGAAGPRFDRQVRVGAAFDAAAIGGPGLVVAVDADTRTYGSPTGERRMVAAGVEQWLAGRRVGLRAGARRNQTGAREQAYSAGASVRLTDALYVDGYLERGRGGAPRGWGIATRVSY